MKKNKKFAVIVSLAGLAAIGTAATTFRQGKAKPEEQFVNLKVLPKDISSKDLQEIMADDFEDGLGVSCGFCHASAPDGHGLDFASDAKPEKEIARAMMRMTLGINKKYFKIKHPLIGNAGLAVSCTSCHKGQAFPDGTDQK